MLESCSESIDLAPLKDAPLKSLKIKGTKVANLDAVKGIPGLVISDK